MFSRMGMWDSSTFENEIKRIFEMAHHSTLRYCKKNEFRSHVKFAMSTFGLTFQSVGNEN